MRRALTLYQALAIHQARPKLPSFARLPSDRSSGSKYLSHSAPQPAQASEYTISALHSPLQSIAKVPLVVPAKLGEEALQAAQRNAVLRRASFSSTDAERLKELERMRSILSTKLIENAQERKKLAAEIQDLSAQADKGKDNVLLNKKRERARELKEEIKSHGVADKEITREVIELHNSIPNTISPNTPIGGDQEARIVGFGGDFSLLPHQLQVALQQPTALQSSIKSFEDNITDLNADTDRDHVKLLQEKGWRNAAAARHITGESSWPLLFGPVAMLEHALENYALSKAIAAGFAPVVVPDVARASVVADAGFSPREGSGSEIYRISAQDSSASKSGADSQLALAATAEIPLAGILHGKRFNESQLPLQLTASSHAFRAEAGARGQASRGLYRMHQFTKVELFIACSIKDSDACFERLRAFQEDIVSPLGIPYRVLEMPSEELGASAYRKYDIEAWMPGRGDWGEISSASNCTDFQAKRLQCYYFENARADEGQLFEEDSTVQGMAKSNVKSKEPTKHFVHTLNGTAIAAPRIIVALLENYGLSSSGRLRLPVVLREHWFASDVDNVDWFTPPNAPLSGKQSKGASSKNPSAIQSALARVRASAERSGTDPASMVISFLLLHEITAIVPLVLIFYLLGLLGAGTAVMQWLLEASSDAGSTGDSEGLFAALRSRLRQYIREGMQRAEKYGRRKGYFGFEKQSQDDPSASTTALSEEVDVSGATAVAGTFANAVAAYAITKALFPLRLAACLGLAAPFARWFIEPAKRGVRKWRSRS